MSDRVPFYWSSSLNPLILDTFQLAYISAQVDKPNLYDYSYQGISSLIPEDDPVSLMVIMYTMLRMDNHMATFIIDSDYLYLMTEKGYITLNSHLSNMIDDPACDAETLYVFSPRYKDIPGTVESITTMFSSYILNENQFRLIISKAIDNQSWDYIPSIMNILQLSNILTDDLGPILQKLRLSIIKCRLLQKTRKILEMYPCPP